MTVGRGFLITIASGLGFGCFGGLTGYMIGTVAPDYYRTVFDIPPGEPINLAQAGFGLGLTQGLTAGIVIGLALVVTVAWYNSRVAAGSPAAPARPV